MVHIEICGLQAEKLQEFYEKLKIVLRSPAVKNCCVGEIRVTAQPTVFLTKSFVFMKLYYNLSGFRDKDKSEAERLGSCIYRSLEEMGVDIPVYLIEVVNEIYRR